MRIKMHQKNVKYALLAGIVMGFTASMLYDTTTQRMASLNEHGNVKLGRNHLPDLVSSNVVRQMKTIADGPITSPEPKPPRKYHLLLNSNMNSGSRFTGRLFGFREKTFYFYEPLWHFNVWHYFDEPNYVCASTEGNHCAISTADQVNSISEKGNPLDVVPFVNKNSTISDLMVSILDRIYRCDFTGFENLVVSYVTDKENLAGPSWAIFRACVKGGSSPTECLDREMAVCRNASHIVTKVLRLTTAPLERLLAQHDDVKVLQLFRHPMAIINSRIESMGYPVTDFNSNADVLCRKMMKDYRGAMNLSAKYPDRVKMIFYEDLKSNVPLKIQTLYDFIGMDYDRQAVQKLNRVSPNMAERFSREVVRSRVQDNAHWWRSHMAHVRYKGAMERCHEDGIVDLFNLTWFKTHAEMQNLRIPDMAIPKHMLI